MGELGQILKPPSCKQQILVLLFLPLFFFVVFTDVLLMLTWQTLAPISYQEVRSTCWDFSLMPSGSTRSPVTRLTAFHFLSVVYCPKCTCRCKTCIGYIHFNIHKTLKSNLIVFLSKISLPQVYITCYMKAVRVNLTVSSQNKACSLIEKRYTNNTALLKLAWSVAALLENLE